MVQRQITGKNLMLQYLANPGFYRKLKASFYGKRHDPFVILAPTNTHSKLKFGDCIEINMYIYANMLTSTLQWLPVVTMVTCIDQSNCHAE